MTIDFFQMAGIWDFAREPLKTLVSQATPCCPRFFKCSAFSPSGPHAFELLHLRIALLTWDGVVCMGVSRESDFNLRLMTRFSFELSCLIGAVKCLLKSLAWSLGRVYVRPSNLMDGFGGSRFLPSMIRMVLQSFSGFVLLIKCLEGIRAIGQFGTS